MKLSTKTILVLGIVQCIILSLILVLFLRYQHSLKSDQSRVELEAEK
ncbi:MAG: hypothetical protein ACEQSB_02410 [Undibacterium sp.]